MTCQNKGQTDLASLIRILKECGAKKVYLFGSLAEGKARPGSDIDLACEGLSPERFFEALGKLLLHSERAVDLIDLDETKEPLRTRIEREGLLPYEAN